MKSGGNPRFTGPLGVGRSPTVERDRNRTADIRWAQYVAPISETEHWAKNLGNGQLYRVGSAGPVVFKRGQKVQLSSSTGIGPEIILGYPGSKKGGSSMTKRTFSKSFAAPVEPPGEAVATQYTAWFVEDSSDPFTVTAKRLGYLSETNTYVEISENSYSVPGTYHPDSANTVESTEADTNEHAGWISVRHDDGAKKYSFMAPDGSSRVEVPAQLVYGSSFLAWSPISSVYALPDVPDGLSAGYYYATGFQTITGPPRRIRFGVRRVLTNDLSFDVNTLLDIRPDSPLGDEVTDWGLFVMDSATTPTIGIITSRPSGTYVSTGVTGSVAVSGDAPLDMNFVGVNRASAGVVSSSNAAMQRLSRSALGAYSIGYVSVVGSTEIPDEMGSVPATFSGSLRGNTGLGSWLWHDGSAVISASEILAPSLNVNYAPASSPAFITRGGYGS